MVTDSLLAVLIGYTRRYELLGTVLDVFLVKVLCTGTKYLLSYWLFEPGAKPVQFFKIAGEGKKHVQKFYNSLRFPVFPKKIPPPK